MNIRSSKSFNPIDDKESNDSILELLTPFFSSTPLSPYAPLDEEEQVLKALKKKPAPTAPVQKEAAKEEDETEDLDTVGTAKTLEKASENAQLGAYDCKKKSKSGNQQTPQSSGSKGTEEKTPQKPQESGAGEEQNAQPNDDFVPPQSPETPPDGNIWV